MALTISRLRWVWLLFLTVFVSSAFPHFAWAATGSSALSWQPRGEKIWVFVVGLVKFQHHDVFDDFPTKGRRDARLAAWFRTHGVPQNHITYLQDAQAKQKIIGPALIKILRQTQPGDTLFLYYEGHGYRAEDDSKDGFFAAYDTDDDEVSGWSIGSICPTINQYFRGDRAFLTADCCDSGYLAQVVGRQKGRIAYACVASSSAREVSTAHWTFSDCLLYALEGMPFVDLNGDGVVTMGEFAAFSHSEMALAEEQHSAFALAGDFPPDAVISTSRPKVKAPIGQRVRVKYGDDWLAGRVLATKPGKILVGCIGYDDPPDWFDTDDASQLRPIKPGRTFAVGSRVEVEWKGDWYAAQVLKVEGGVHFIHYVEDDSSWDEWVSAKRIRAAQ